ncbi:Conserved_hypothetical protein [Hexamita inflata]|uniref:Uncharacterized protein n=1 Tax=Hexamita inflata TaxID=28002 RepID=A0AA86QNQ2_9EUKA|nr:Conserved hypothetical protein [Hexamita inflata]
MDAKDEEIRKYKGMYGSSCKQINYLNAEIGKLQEEVTIFEPNENQYLKDYGKLLEAIDNKIYKVKVLGMQKPHYTLEAKMLWTIRRIISTSVFRMDQIQLGSRIFGPIIKENMDLKQCSLNGTTTVTLARNSMQSRNRLYWTQQRKNLLWMSQVLIVTREITIQLNNLFSKLQIGSMKKVIITYIKYTKMDLNSPHYQLELTCLRDLVGNQSLCPFHFRMNSTNNIYIDKRELYKILPHCNAQVFSESPILKLRDDLSLHLYSKKSIEALLKQSITASNIKAVIYFLTIYHLELLFTKIEPLIFQKIYVLTLYFTLKLHKRGQDFERFSEVIKGKEETIDYLNRDGTTVLTAFDNAWLEQDIVHCAKVLDLIQTGKKIALVSLDSLICEFWFGKIRMHSQMDNSIDRAKQVIADQLIIDYLQIQLGIELEPNKVHAHHTQDIQITRKLYVKEMEELEDLADTMMELITHEYPSNEKIEKVEQDKFKKIIKFWNEIQKCGPEEMYWKNIQLVVARQPDYQSCNEAQGIRGRLFAIPINDVNYKVLMPPKRIDKK